MGCVVLNTLMLIGLLLVWQFLNTHRDEGSTFLTMCENIYHAIFFNRYVTDCTFKLWKATLGYDGNLFKQ